MAYLRRLHPPKSPNYCISYRQLFDFGTFFLFFDNRQPTHPTTDYHHKSVKMAPKKKTKTGDTLNSRLALVMKSGKVTLGYKSTLKGKCEFSQRVCVYRVRFIMLTDCFE